MNTSFIKRNLFLGLCVASVGLFSACSDSDNKNGNDGDDDNGGIVESKPFFLSLAGAGESEYLLQIDNIESGTYSIKDNFKQLEQSGYTWLFSDNHKHALGLLYKKGDPGVSLAYEKNSKGKFEQKEEFIIKSRYTTYGFFEDYAITSVGGQATEDSNIADGVIFNVIDLKNDYNLSPSDPIHTLGVFNEGQIATFSGIADTGRGTFLTGVVVSEPKDPSVEGGSSTGAVTEPNKVWVAEINNKFKIVRTFEDDRISYSSGRHRSQYYSQIGIADDGTTYVFSGSYDENTELPAGALKINKGAEDFDKNYYFNIQEKTGHKFRKVWHITQDYFMLEVYNTNDPITVESVATKYAIVKMGDKTFNWVENIPAENKIITTGLPFAYEGKMLFPITAENSDPVIYIIDPVTATAKKGTTVKGTSAIRAIGYLD